MTILHKIILMLGIFIYPFELVSYDNNIEFVQTKYLELPHHHSVDYVSKKLTDGQFIDHRENSFEPTYTLNRLWVFLEIENNSSDDFVVSSVFPLLNNFEVYKMNHLGSFVNHDSHGSESGSFRTKESAKYLISMSSYNTMGIKFLARKMDIHYKEKIEIQFILMAIIAIFFAFVLYNLLLWLVLKDVSFLYYCFFILANGFSVLVVNDFPSGLNTLLGAAFHDYAAISRALFPLTTGLFAYSVLFKENESKTMSRRILFYANSFLVAMACCAIIPYFRHTIRLSWDYIFLVYSILTLSLTIYEIKKEKIYSGFSCFHK